MALYEKDFILSQIEENPSIKWAYGGSLLRILYLNQEKPKDKRFKICKDVVATIPIVIFTKQDFYLMDELNEKIVFLRASGLIEYWQFQDIDKDFLNFKESCEPKVLTLTILEGCFHILLIGWFGSLIAFIFELISKYV